MWLADPRLQITQTGTGDFFMRDLYNYLKEKSPRISREKRSSQAIAFKYLLMVALEVG
jgi:hypothetical protein